MAVSERVDRRHKNLGIVERWGLTASGTVYEGCLLCLTDGDPDLAVNGNDTAGFVFVGICDVANYETDTTAVNGGTMVHSRHSCYFKGFTFSHSVSAAAFSYSNMPVDLSLYIADADSTVSIAAVTTNDIRCGRMRRATTKAAAGGTGVVDIFVVTSSD